MREEPTYCGDFPESFLMACLAIAGRIRLWSAHTVIYR